MKKDYELRVFSFKEKLNDEDYRKLLDSMHKKGFHLESVNVSDNTYIFVKFFK